MSNPYIDASNLVLNKCTSLYKSADRRSILCKILSNFEFFIIVVCCCCTTVLGILIGMDTDVIGPSFRHLLGYIISSIGILSGCIKLIDSKYNFSKQAIQYKNMALVFNKKINDVIILNMENKSIEEKMANLLQISSDIDDNSVDLFLIELRDINNSQ